MKFKFRSTQYGDKRTRHFFALFPVWRHNWNTGVTEFRWLQWVTVKESYHGDGVPGDTDYWHNDGFIDARR